MQQFLEIDESIQFDDYQDYCLKSGIGVKKLMNLINNLPREDLLSFKYDEEYPEFITYILNEDKISNQGALDFMERIGIRYLRSNFFRKLLDNWTFLFLDMEYQGVYHSSAYAHFVNKDKIDRNTRVEFVETKIETQNFTYPFIVS